MNQSFDNDSENQEVLLISNIYSLFKYQYLVGNPLFFITSAHRFGIVATNLLHSSGGNSFHTWSIIFFNSSFVFGSGSECLITHFIVFHTH